MANAVLAGSFRFGMLARVAATVAALGLWFWTQSLIGSRAPSEGINDALHNLFAGLNSYFGQHASAVNVLLIVSSGLVDILGLLLVAEWICVGRSRAFLGLVLLLGLRQVMQALCALPAPQHHLALPRLSLAICHLQRWERFFFLRSHSQRRFRGD
jgi:hypothetical protein